MTNIFISYRRADSRWQAKAIYDILTKEKRSRKDTVFFDIDSMIAGRDFRKQIQSYFEKTDFVVVVIGSKWLEVVDEEGENRLRSASDPVRVEIEMALRLGVPVIPILLDSTAMPGAEQLPQSLAELTDRHAIRVQAESFQYDVERLISAVYPSDAAKDRPFKWPLFVSIVLSITLLVLIGYFALDLSRIDVIAGNDKVPLESESLTSVGTAVDTQSSDLTGMIAREGAETSEVQRSRINLPETESFTDDEGGNVGSALLVANRDYQSDDLDIAASLQSVEDLASVLADLGWHVTLVRNGDSRTTKRALSNFEKRLKGQASGHYSMFYFTGHAGSIDGRNYILPTDTELTKQSDLQIFGLATESIYRLFPTRGGVNIALFDSSAHLPFSILGRSASTGLEREESRRHFFIGYATSPGGNAEIGPFTEQIVQELLSSPNVDFPVFFKKVRNKVHERTGGDQVPWTWDSITGSASFSGVVDR